MLPPIALSVDPSSRCEELTALEALESSVTRALIRDFKQGSHHCIGGLIPQASRNRRPHLQLCSQLPPLGRRPDEPLAAPPLALPPRSLAKARSEASLRPLPRLSEDLCNFEKQCPRTSSMNLSCLEDRHRSRPLQDQIRFDQKQFHGRDRMDSTCSTRVPSAAGSSRSGSRTVSRKSSRTRSRAGTQPCVECAQDEEPTGQEIIQPTRDLKRHFERWGDINQAYASLFTTTPAPAVASPSAYANASAVISSGNPRACPKQVGVLSLSGPAPEKQQHEQTLDVRSQHLEETGGPRAKEANLVACLREGWATVLQVASVQGLGNLSPADVQDANHAFSAYDTNGSGTLDVAQFGALLLDQGIELDYKSACQAVETVAGFGERTVDFEAFLRLVDHTKADKAETREKLRGYSEDQAEILQSVFDAYDRNKSGLLETVEYSALLADLGRVPRDSEEQKHLAELIAKCRGGDLGPLNFQEFLALARCVDQEDGVACEDSVLSPPVVSQNLGA